MKHQQDQTKRKERELYCQLLSLGALLSSPTDYCDSIQPVEMVNKPLGTVVDSVQGLVRNNSDKSKKDSICHWLKSNCGVEVKDKEKFIDAITRTVKENSKRREAESLTYLMHQLSLNPDIGDVAYIDDLKKRVNAL